MSLTAQLVSRIAGLLLLVATSAHPNDIPVLTVCEVLQKRESHDGRPVVVVGEFRRSPEGTWIAGKCDPPVVSAGYTWASLVWIAHQNGDARLPAFAWDKTAILRAIQADNSKDDLVTISACHATAAKVAAYGIFESKARLPVRIYGTGEMLGVGYGHLGQAPAQLLIQDGSVRCIQPGPSSEDLQVRDAEKTRQWQSALWRNLRSALFAADGAAYFRDYVQDSRLPTLTGTIFRIDWEQGKPSLVLRVDENTVFDAEVHLPLTEVPPPVGSVVAFEGVAREFRTKPYLLIMDVDADHIRVVAAHAMGRSPR